MTKRTRPKIVRVRGDRYDIEDASFLIRSTLIDQVITEYDQLKWDDVAAAALTAARTTETGRDRQKRRYWTVEVAMDWQVGWTFRLTEQVRESKTVLVLTMRDTGSITTDEPPDATDDACPIDRTGEVNEATEGSDGIE